MPFPSQLQDDAYQFGMNIAFAQHLRQDLQKFADLTAPLNLLSTPVIVSALEPPVRNLLCSILDQDSSEEETQRAHQDLFNHIQSGSSYAQMQGLCEFYSCCALESLRNLPDSEAKQALENITYSVTQ